MSTKQATTVVAVLASHNRRETTMACLARLGRQTGAEIDLCAVLVDDASQDGTAAAVAQAFPWVRVVPGTGTLYWSRGMRLAASYAIQRDPAHLLWLNDDTILSEDALPRLLDVAVGAPDAIIVGTTRTSDPTTAKPTYGGLLRRSPLRLRFDRVDPDPAVPLPCDTFNGNIVLISRAAYRRVGNIDPRLVHVLGDIEYGMRARSLGVRCLVAPGYYGTCDHSDLVGTWYDPRVSLVRRIRGILGAKGLPPRVWAHFLRRYGGPAWPLIWASPYAKTLLSRGT
jgi:GT2 family glycosyltransferase